MAISLELLKRLIIDQHDDELLPQEYIERSILQTLETLKNNREIIVLTGLRRCGKSVLLQHMRSTLEQSDYYFNFEDERLVNFTLDDFQYLHEAFMSLYGVQKNFYFDEIQNIPGWEMFVRRLYNSGNKIYITGSNANLFSEELGTRLTGRYIAVTIYPLSFSEYVQHRNPELNNTAALGTSQIVAIKHLLSEYIQYGGIPEYIKYRNKSYIHSLYESIIYRDIITRYKVAHPDAIKKILFYLASNCGKTTTYSALRKMSGVNSVSTVSEYCGYIANSFLCFFVHRYEDSLKAQIQSEKKVYFIDHVIAAIIGFRISADHGRMLENIVFLELRRRGYDIYYYRGKTECDFVLRQQEHTVQLIQVSQELYDLETKQREFAGLLEAMVRFDLCEGLIITENEDYREVITRQDKEYIITVEPLWRWLLNNKENIMLAMILKRRGVS